MDTAAVLWWLGALAAGLWFWERSMRARESAVRAARSACATQGVELLDHTVALARLRPVRCPGGRLCLERVYRFEFSRGGDDRHSGWVLSRGGLPRQIALEGRDGNLIVPP